MNQQKISCYILTYNSERWLPTVLKSLSSLIDELVIVDSGSNDSTLDIAKEFSGKIYHREFDDFVSQRNFALTHCNYPWILAVDSDEVMDPKLLNRLKQLKANNFCYQNQFPDGFQLPRRWILFGREVRAFLPITSPDYPLRLFKKSKAQYDANRCVYEDLDLSTLKIVRLNTGALWHYSCDDDKLLEMKLQCYTDLAARDLARRGKTAGNFKCWLSTVANFWKWYIVKQGWRDGRVGWKLGRYAARYAYLKYYKLTILNRAA